MSGKLVIGGVEFSSRLWVGTGKYKDFEETRLAVEARPRGPMWLRLP
jgi:thiazole synthase